MFSYGWAYRQLATYHVMDTSPINAVLPPLALYRHVLPFLNSSRHIFSLDGKRQGGSDLGENGEDCHAFLSQIVVKPSFQSVPFYLLMIWGCVFFGVKQPGRDSLDSGSNETENQHESTNACEEGNEGWCVDTYWLPPALPYMHVSFSFDSSSTYYLSIPAAMVYVSHRIIHITPPLSQTLSGRTASWRSCAAATRRSSSAAS